MSTYRRNLRLLHPILDPAIHRRPRIPMDRRAATFTLQMHVDRKKPAPAIHRLPRRGQRLPAVVPSAVGGLDPAGIELELRAGQDNRGIRAGAWVGLVQAEHLRVVEIGGADVAAGRTAVLVVDWVDVHEGVLDTAGGLDGCDEVCEGGVGVDD